MAGRPFDPSQMTQLENLAHRGYTEGFLRRHHHGEYQNYTTGNSISEQQQFVGEIVARDRRRGLIEVDVKNKFSVGDQLELMTPKGNISFTLDKMLDQHSSPIDVAKGSGHKVLLPLPEGAQEPDYGILMRYLKVGQDTRNPHLAV